MTAKENNKFGMVEGTFVYAKVGQPDNKYQSDTEKEWSIGVVVDEQTAEAWDDKFVKQKAKKVKASEFEAKYRIPCPIDGVRNVYVINLKRQATNDGVPVDEGFRPKVFVDDADGERTEIGQSRKVANGSYGKVSYYISTNTFGTFSRLQNVLMDEKDFIEYEGGGSAGDEFGSKPVKVEAPKESTMNARPEKPKKAAPKKVEEEVGDSSDSDESPF